MTSSTAVQPPVLSPIGVEMIGVGSALPSRRLTNADLETMMDTTDEWIVQRTGIRERRILDVDKGESNWKLCTEALRGALADAKIDPAELDLVLVATCTPEMGCPSVACRVAGELGAGGDRAAGAFDITAACCGFVYGINIAHDLIRSGNYRTIGVVGCDTLSTKVDYYDEGRTTAILFGDAAGAAVLRATDDTSKGIVAQSMHANGKEWKELYIPNCERDFPEGEYDPAKVGRMQMQGRTVFRFAVTTFSNVIQETLDEAGIEASDVAMFICHQSNARILHTARERFGLPEEKLYVNIDRFGNTSAGSVPLCLYELRQQGKIKTGDLVMFVAFGGGLTWASSLWRL